MASPENLRCKRRSAQSAAGSGHRRTSGAPASSRAYADFKGFLSKSIARASTPTSVDAEWFRVAATPNLAVLYFHGGAICWASTKSHQL